MCSWWILEFLRRSEKKNASKKVDLIKIIVCWISFFISKLKPLFLALLDALLAQWACMTYKYENRIKKLQSEQKLQYSKDNASQRKCIEKLYLKFKKIPLFLCAHILLYYRTSRKCLGDLLVREYGKNLAFYYLFVTNM